MPPSVIPSCAEKQVSDNFLSIIDASSPDPGNLFYLRFVKIPIQRKSYDVPCVSNVIFSNDIGFTTLPAKVNILHEIVASNKGQLMVGDFLCDVHVCFIQDSMG